MHTLGDERPDEALLDRGLAGDDAPGIPLGQADLAGHRGADGAELDAHAPGSRGADAAPLDEDLVCIQRADASHPDLDVVRRGLGDAAALEPEAGDARSTGEGAGVEGSGSGVGRGCSGGLGCGSRRRARGPARVPPHGPPRAPRPTAPRPGHRGCACGTVSPGWASRLSWGSSGASQQRAGGGEPTPAAVRRPRPEVPKRWARSGRGSQGSPGAHPARHRQVGWRAARESPPRRAVSASPQLGLSCGRTGVPSGSTGGRVRGSVRPGKCRWPDNPRPRRTGMGRRTREPANDAKDRSRPGHRAARAGVVAGVAAGSLLGEPGRLADSPASPSQSPRRPPPRRQRRRPPRHRRRRPPGRRIRRRCPPPRLSRPQPPRRRPASSPHPSRACP